MSKRRSRSYDRLLLPAFLILLVAFGALAARKYFVSGRPAAPPAATAEAEPKRMREIILYFGAPEGTYLLPEAREIEDCPVESDCLHRVVLAMIDGPVGDLVPILPPRTMLRKADILDGTAVLDFSRDLLSGHPGGSISELLTVYGVADALAVNFPHVRQVRFLVDGQMVETLKGHMSLQEPIQADFGFARPPESILAEEEAAAGEKERKI